MQNKTKDSLLLKILISIFSICIMMICIIGIIFNLKIGMKKKVNLFSNSYNVTNQVEENASLTENVEDSTYIFDYSWVNNMPCLIAHACGGIDELTYTNTLEAFEHNYKLGHRIFEVDFAITEPENTLVVAHDGRHWKTQISKNTITPKNDFTYENFMTQKIYDKYTAIDYEGMIDLMIKYPDAYIVTDTKYTDPETVYLQFSQLARCAMKKDPNVLDRIVPQIYNEEMLDWVMNVHEFKSVIFTLYATQWTPESVYDFCKESNVRFITIPRGLINEETLKLWDELGITVATHTSNDKTETD